MNYFYFRPVAQMLDFSIFSSCNHFCSMEQNHICVILVKGIMGNIHVKLFKIWTSGWLKNHTGQRLITIAYLGPLARGAKKCMDASAITLKFTHDMCCIQIII